MPFWKRTTGKRLFDACLQAARMATAPSAQISNQKVELSALVKALLLWE
jgi:hypothetical protein